MGKKLKKTNNSHPSPRKKIRLLWLFTFAKKRYHFLGKRLKKTRNSPLPPPEENKVTLVIYFFEKTLPLFGKFFFSLAPPLSKCRRGPCYLVKIRIIGRANAPSLVWHPCNLPDFITIETVCAESNPVVVATTISFFASSF